MQYLQLETRADFDALSLTGRFSQAEYRFIEQCQLTVIDVFSSKLTGMMNGVSSRFILGRTISALDKTVGSRSP
jgi:hypothetical protein